VQGPALGTSLVDVATVLTERVLIALDGAGGIGLADQVDRHGDDLTSFMGGVRLVGADLFAPQLLDRRPMDLRDVSVVADSFKVFPPVGAPGNHEQRVRAWRDWATHRVVNHLTGRDEPAPPLDTDVLDVAGSWQRWSVIVAQLSTLAMPGIGGPIVDAVARDSLQLARGVTRAVLRRDYTTASRLVRWVALLAGMGVRVPLDPALLLDHVRLHGGSASRVALDLAIAARLLEQERS
jgi:hypothetical protein